MLIGTDERVNTASYYLDWRISHLQQISTDVSCGGITQVFMCRSVIQSCGNLCRLWSGSRRIIKINESQLYSMPVAVTPTELARKGAGDNSASQKHRTVEVTKGGVITRRRSLAKIVTATTSITGPTAPGTFAFWALHRFARIPNLFLAENVRRIFTCCSG